MWLTCKTIICLCVKAKVLICLLTQSNHCTLKNVLFDVGWLSDSGTHQGSTLCPSKDNVIDLCCQCGTKRFFVTATSQNNAIVSVLLFCFPKVCDCFSKSSGADVRGLCQTIHRSVLLIGIVHALLISLCICDLPTVSGAKTLCLNQSDADIMC